MRKLFHVMLLAAVCCGCLVSCNEKPKSYRYVKVMPDGKEVVEKIEAENDTVAAKIFLDRMVQTFSQPLVARHSTVEWTLVNDLDETERGAGGFGHTGTK